MESIGKKFVLELDIQEGDIWNQWVVNGHVYPPSVEQEFEIDSVTETGVVHALKLDNKVYLAATIHNPCRFNDDLSWRWQIEFYAVTPDEMGFLVRVRVKLAEDGTPILEKPTVLADPGRVIEANINLRSIVTEP